MGMRINEEDWELFGQAAELVGTGMSEWGRSVMLAEAKKLIDADDRKKKKP